MFSIFWKNEHENGQEKETTARKSHSERKSYEQDIDQPIDQPSTHITTLRFSFL